MKYAFLRFPGFLNKAVTLSYDDGRPADERLVAVMNAHGLKGTFNLNSFRLDDNLSDRVKNLYLPTGNEIAVHGFYHLALTNVSDSAALNDIITDRKTLESLSGRIVNGMAYANGSVNAHVTDLVRACGIVYSRTTVSTHGFSIPENWLLWNPTCHHNDPRLFELAEAFVGIGTPPAWYYDLSGPKLFYLWGHSYEFDNDGNWDRIEKFASMVGGRSDIWYATNREIYSYISAFNSLIFSADGGIVYNPTVTELYTEFYGRKVIIPAGSTAALPTH